MAVRFRRSVKLAPGLRMNLSGSGLGLSFGPRGAKVTTGPRGTFVHGSLPGTGLYSRKKVSGGQARAPAKGASAAGPNEGQLLTIKVDDTTGEVAFLGEDGQPASEAVVGMAKKQHGSAIRELLEGVSKEREELLRELESVHVRTRRPDDRPVFQPVEFPEKEPRPPAPVKAGLVAGLLPWVRKRAERENFAMQETHREAVNTWEAGRREHLAGEEARRHRIEVGLTTDRAAMEQVLEERLTAIDWPRETKVDFEISENLRSISLDVDLPEIEDLPAATFSLPERGYRLSVKKLSDRRRQELYMRHVHGVGFRLIGEAFATLPTVTEVTLSAYSQRADRGTGQVADEYLYSARVTRAAWEKLAFGNLQAIDVTEALAQFELRRAMSKTGAFRAIEPFPARVREKA